MTNILFLIWDANGNLAYTVTTVTSDFDAYFIGFGVALAIFGLGWKLKLAYKIRDAL